MKKLVCIAAAAALVAASGLAEAKATHKAKHVYRGAASGPMLNGGAGRGSPSLLRGAERPTQGSQAPSNDRLGDKRGPSAGEQE